MVRQPTVYSCEEDIGINSSFLLVPFRFSLPLCLRLLLLSKELLYRLLFLVFIQQIGNILLSVPHHKRIITVINNEPTFAAYYAKKRAEGKEHRVALTHVAKKLLRVIYTLQTKELSYNPDFVR